jgi:hypothetical protein
MTICPALRGISLILAPLDEVSKTFETSNKGGFSGIKKPSVFYLTGQVVAAYSPVRLTPHDFGGPRKRDFAKLNLHLPACRSLGAGRALFEQPGKDDFFSSLKL